MRQCNLCSRQLDVVSDPLSVDCGGDCFGCIQKIENDMDSFNKKSNKEKVLALLHSDFEGPAIPCTCDAFLQIEYDQPWFPLTANLHDRYGGAEYAASPYKNRILSLLFVKPCSVEAKTEDKLWERLARVMHLAYNEPLKYRAWFVYKAAGLRKIRRLHLKEWKAALETENTRHNANELMQQREDELEDAALDYAEKSNNNKKMRKQK